MRRPVPFALISLAVLGGCGGPPTPSSALDLAFPAPDGGSVAPPDLAAPPVAHDCKTSFRFVPPMHETTVAVAGEWNQFDPTHDLLAGPDQNGAFTGSLAIPQGAFGYKIVVGVDPNRTWLLDPQNPYTKYVGGVQNSLIEVPDCKAPTLVFRALTKTADGTLHAEATYVDGAGGAGTDAAHLSATLDGGPAKLGFDAASRVLSVDATALAKTKHRLVFHAADSGGRKADDLHVPFWIEDAPFDWRDGILYFAFTDRFQDGDPGNNAPVADTDGRANYAGGDFKGIQKAIEAGYFDALGVRTLWISPPFPNPDHFELGSDGRHYSGYHGYWPISGVGTQKRFGDSAALKAMVGAAHARGIRVLVDSVMNHVHKEHPYYLDHKNDGWFNGDGSCVCGGANCDWDVHRLDCWFTSYLPDLNYQTFPVLQAMVDDALYWAREVDVDGFRVDAVKHFPHDVGVRLRSKLHDLFEHDDALTYYLVGETFTGGDDAGRQLIASFLGPHELTAQFDFPMYWNLLGAFTGGESLKSLEAAAAASDGAFGDAPMSPFFGNHDVPRFITTAAGMLQGDPKEQAWSAPPPSPASDAPYQQLRLALATLYTQPGVPLLYYGDEFGMPGAGDPDNRRMMKWSGYSPAEQATIEVAKKLGAARRELSALRRGGRYTMWVDDDLYVYARGGANAACVVAVNRAAAPRSQSVTVRPEAPIADGTVLKDRLGGPPVTVSGGKLTIQLGSRTAAILAP